MTDAATTDLSAWALPQSLVAALAAQGITTPTPIQAEAVPKGLAGESLLLQAPTGTGKTLAFLIPLLTRIDPAAKHVQAVVLAPTHELAMQIVEQARKLTEKSGIAILPLIGGAALSRQIEKLKLKPQVVIGSPGRILEHVTSGRLKLHQAQSLVLDEVDRLMEAKALADVEAIIKATPAKRQLIGASATLPPAVLTWAERWAPGVQAVQALGSGRPAESLTHLSLLVDPRDKIEALRRLVHATETKGAIVFVKDPKKMVELLDKLRFKGLAVESLHSGEGKEERATLMRRFRAGDYQILIATDVAARGLDLPQVDLVVNFDLPTDAPAYLHRAGRTGRMGRPGTVVSLVATQDVFVVEKFGKTLGVTIEPVRVQGGKVEPLPPRSERPAFTPRTGKPKFKPNAKPGAKPKPKP